GGRRIDEPRHPLPGRGGDEGHRDGGCHSARRAGQSQTRGAPARDRSPPGVSSRVGGLPPPPAAETVRRPRARPPHAPPDASGAPKLRPAKRPITLRHLLTHTAGFTYDIWSPDTVRYVKVTGLPNRATGKVVSLRTPLAFDPGDRWLYGINIEWTGRLIETVSGQALEDYFREQIFGPLGMKDSTYVTSSEQRARQARLHTRGPDGALAVHPLEPVPVKGEFWPAGGPLYSTARDYLAFLQMLLNRGPFNGARLLKPETVALMNQNHVGNIPCGVLKAELRNLSNDVDFFPGADIRWGYGYMLNLQPGPNGRSAGTVSWGGLFN